MFRSIRQVLPRPLCLLLVATSLIGGARASTTVSASKQDLGSCQSTPSGTIAIATTQIVHWNATRTLTANCGNGGSFALDAQNGPPLNDITLSTSLPDGIPNSGDASLSPGNYVIFINFGATGAGNYSVTFNRQAALNITPTSHSFGNVLANASSASSSFAIKNIGDADDFAVTIGSVTISGPQASNFAITSNPSGQVLASGISKTVGVQCVGNNSPGMKSATINVHGTGGGQNADTSATVSCNVQPLIPTFACAATTNLGSADWMVPGSTVSGNVVLKNTGTAPLTITSDVMTSAAAPGVFTNGALPTGTVAPGSSVNAPLTFHASVAGAEGTYGGHLTVTHNAAGSPSTCNFTATAHHPVPIMAVDSQALDFHDVELGFTFTKAIVVHNNGDATLTFTVADPSPLPADAAQWSERDTATASIAPGGAAQIFKQACKPNALGSYAMTMSVTGNDLVHPSLPVLMTCAGTAPVPIDAMLVMDRSGSMAGQLGSTGPKKIEVLQRAASLFVDLVNLRAATVPAALADKTGLVKYNDTNALYQPLDIDTGAHHDDAINTLLAPAAVGDAARLLPSGTTGIGGAMKTGAAQLVGSPSDRKHVMVLLTDGMENQAPFISDVMNGPNSILAMDPALKIFSIGLGTDADVDVGKLQSITNQSNGFFQVTHELDDLHIFDLEAFFFKIFTESAGWQMVVDPTFVADLSINQPIVIDTAHVTTSDHSAMFVALDIPALRSMYTLELVDPNGQAMVPGSDVGGVPIHIQSNNDYRIVRVIFPDISQSASYVGDWVLRLTPNSSWDPAKIRRLLEGNPGLQGNGQIAPLQGRVPIGFGAAVASDYQLAVAALPSGTEPGAAITLTATLTDRGWPSTGGTATVDIDSPSGTHYPAVVMYDDGSHGDATANDGVFTTRFLQTPQAGAYKFYFKTLGHNDRGELAPREATRYVSLTSPVVTGGGGPNGGGDCVGCIPCRVQYLLWAIVIGLLLLSLLCCYLRYWRVG